MSRIGPAVCTVSLVLAVFGLAPRNHAQEKKTPSPSLYELLETQIDTKSFTEPLALKDFLKQLRDRCTAKGFQLPLVLDLNAFREADESQPNGPVDDEIKLPGVPQRMPLGQVLRLGLIQIKNANGTYIIRNGAIVITTLDRAHYYARAREVVVGRFDKTPFAEVIARLSDMTGATVLLDPRLKEKAEVPITAEFHGNATLHAALLVLTDMASLGLVRMDGCVYITTPANAEALERRLRNAREEFFKQQMRVPGANQGS